jgi:hypothetical protein
MIAGTMSTTTNSRVYSVREAAQVAGVSEWLAGEEIRNTGSLAGVAVIRIGRRVVIPKDALDNALGATDTRLNTGELEARIQSLEKEHAELKRLLRDIAREIERVL